MLPTLALAAVLAQGSVTIASQTKLPSPQPVQNGGFGRTVALRGDDAVLQDGFSTQIVRTFRRNGPLWSNTADLPPPLFSDLNSTEIDIDGDWLVVGDGGFSLTGGAWMYRRVGGVWQYFQYLPLPHQVGYPEWYGFSVDLEGERVAIGNPVDSYYSAGVVYVWEYSAALAQWRIRATATSSSGAHHGTGVALHGDDMLVATRGGVQHFRYDPLAVTWNLQGVVLSGLGASPGYNIPSYHPLVISDEGVAVVGDMYDGGSAPSIGTAYVLEKFGLTWSPTATLVPSVPVANLNFGRSVAARGSLIAVGAPGDYFSTTTGAVELFCRNGGWQHSLTVLANGGASGDGMGLAVAIEETGAPLHSTLLAGAPRHDAQGSNAGAAYVFELDQIAALVYCTSKVNSLGCVPRIGFSGMPSASVVSSFTIHASDVISQKNGVFFYGTNGRAHTPFQGAFRCVANPTRRTGTLFSGGNATNDCSGLLTLDFNARIQSGVDPALTVGALVDGQFWYRDGAASFGTGLSEAIEFVIAP